MATDVADVASLAANVKKLIENITPKKATQKEPFRISRLPTFITDRNEGLYQPQVVPIGPYHHNEQKFEAMKRHKHQYLRDFLERSKPIDEEVYMNQMLILKDPAKGCYSDMTDISDEDFVLMLLVDGCFILELLLKLEEEKSPHFFLEGTWDFMTILSDLLLIENQIPFFVLEKLFSVYKGLDSNKNSEESGLKSLVVDKLFMTYLGDGIHSYRVKGPCIHEIHHLLHLYHEVSLPNLEIKDLFSNIAPHLRHKKEDHRLPLVIPSATQLLEFGFVLLKQNSHNHCDATINSSTIKIPRLIIDSTRKALLMNLLAFENALNVRKSRWTGLMIMMNCMVKNERDLEIVQRSGIMLNLLPSDDEAIQFFAQLSKRISINFSDHYFSELFEKINMECEAYFRKKRATFMHEYFNNRWAVISFATSICAILLSTIQTLVSVFTYRRRFL